MADYSAYKETASRHLRFKLQNLSRRLDELEEATKNLQKAEDELLELQDKVIQAEGSNSSMLADVEALRKRVLKIEGKDEEIRKAEELCQLMKEKLEEEESLTRELKSEIERLQKRMAELEKLEEAFGRSKNDCTQLCLSLNEEKNLTKKISTELEVLRAKVKELEQSEDRLDKTEQSLMSELEKLKSLAVAFVSERKHFTEKEKQNEKLIQELTQKLEQNNKLNRADQTRNTSNLLERSSNSILERNDLRIEVDLTTSALPSKETRRKGSLDYLKLAENEARNKSENQKNRNQEDNKVKDLNQEIEKLKTQMKHFESLEEELKTLRAKNNDLHDNFLSEQSKNSLLMGQLEEMKMQIKKQKEMENGEAEADEINLPGRVKHERPKHRAVMAESVGSKHKSRELSPQHRRERIRSREFSFNNESHGQGSKRVTSPNLNSRRATKASSTSALLDTLATDVKRLEDKPALGVHLSSQKEGGTPPAEVKKTREQPSVLSRYPPAAQEHKSWKTSSKPKNDSVLKGKVEKTCQPFNDMYHCRSDELTKPSKAETAMSSSEKGTKTQNPAESPVPSAETRISKTHCGPSNGAAGISCRHYFSTEALATEPTNLKGDTSSLRQHSEESSLKVMNSQEREFNEAALEIAKPLPLLKSRLISRSQEDLLQSHPGPQKEEVDQASALSVNSSNMGLQFPSARAKVINPSSYEKFSTNEEASKVTATPTFDLGIKKESISREFTSSRGAARTSPFENDRNTSGEEELGKSSRASPAASVTGLKSRRQFSPREALRSKAVIKPAIVEKDTKEIMGGTGSGPEANSDKQHSVFKTVSHKMTSSITIYPSEPATQRTSTSEATKEQQFVAASNIRVIPNESSSGVNAASASYEALINKSNMSLKLSETDKNGDCALRSRVDTVVSKSSIVIKPSESIERNSEPAVETISWKSHSSSETNSSETKHITVRNTWRTRRGLLEDSATKAVENATSRNPYRSSTDPSKPEGTSARIYAIEQNSRRASTGVNSWNTPELDSRRTRSSLCASEMLNQKSCISDPVTASPWNCTVLPEENKDFAPSSRRKPFGSFEQLSSTDIPRRRLETKPEPPRQPLGSRTEERRRWSKGCSEDN